MDTADWSGKRAARALVVAVLSVAVLASCVTNAKPKPEAIDEVLMAGEDVSKSFEEAGIPVPEFQGTVEHACVKDESIEYRIVAQYAIEVESAESSALLRTIHELWVEKLGYADVDNGIFWGESGYAVGRAQGNGIFYNVTRQPEGSVINIDVSTDCHEDPDSNDFFRPVEPLETALQ